ncbi:MAG: beta-ketoacyl-ACP synthase III [Hyphomicrobium aestuarii]|nr:beta-ketoacyl-ACP synthase III [Hyphomicrobium aestuarii]
MTTNMTSGVEIIGLGHHAPDRIVTSAELEAQLGLTPGWIERRTGIIERRYAADGEALTDLAVSAATMALCDARSRTDLATTDIRLLLLATSTPDHLLPPSAPLLAHRLGLTAAGGIDLAGACSGFLFTLALADSFVRTHRVALMVVAANVLSRRINPADRGSAVLFADAAGAVVLRPISRATAGIQGLHLASSGADYGLIHIPAGGSRVPFAAELPIMDTRMLLADGRAVYQKAVAMMHTSAVTALENGGRTPTEVAHFVPHQANARMIETVRAGLGIPPHITRSTIAHYGNSSAATIPFTLSMAASNGARPKPGELVLMTAAGAGLSGGAILWGW